MVMGWPKCPAMSKSFAPEPARPRRSRSTSAMSTWATSIFWCRRGSTPTAPTSSAPPSATISSGMRRPPKQTVARKSVELGLRHYSRDDLEAAQAAGQTLDIRVLGLATIAQDVTPELARATIASVEVLGALHASAAVKAALRDRIR